MRSDYWPLYRYWPSEAENGTPFHLDCKETLTPLSEFVATEAHFATLRRTDPDRAAALGALLQAGADERWRQYTQLATIERSIPHAPAPTTTGATESDEPEEVEE